MRLAPMQKPFRSKLFQNFSNPFCALVFVTHSTIPRRADEMRY
jgi:hypothetical protein